MSDITIGMNGADVIADTDTHTSPDGNPQIWFAMQIIEDTILVDETCTINWTDIVDLDGITLPAGLTLYGKFEQIKLVSGTVLMYRKNV